MFLSPPALMARRDSAGFAHRGSGGFGRRRGRASAGLMPRQRDGRKAPARPFARRGCADGVGLCRGAPDRPEMLRPAGCRGHRPGYGGDQGLDRYPGCRPPDACRCLSAGEFAFSLARTARSHAQRLRKPRPLRPCRESGRSVSGKPRRQVLDEIVRILEADMEADQRALCLPAGRGAYLLGIGRES